MTDKQSENSAMMVGAAILNSLGNNTGLSGLSSALEAVNDPNRYLVVRIADGHRDRHAEGLGQIAAINNPLMREARGPLDRILSRILGLSSSLPARRDVFGQALPARGGVGPDIISPIYSSTDRRDPTVDALLGAGLGLPYPSRKVGGCQLGPAEYARYQEVSGTIFKPQLDGLAGSAEWRGLDDEELEDEVRKIVTRGRKEARGMLFGAGRASSWSPPATDALAPMTN